MANDELIQRGTMRCDLCRHWAPAANDWQIDASEMRKCRGVRQRWDIIDEATRDIDSFEDWDRYEAAEKASLIAERAFAADGSDYHAAIYTAGDFFCAKFEAAP